MKIKMTSLMEDIFEIDDKELEGFDENKKQVYIGEAVHERHYENMPNDYKVNWEIIK